jgi:Asp-tRNA(Asn)/Glu-tRNA(Gln) amidotransferase B subunit
MNYDSVMGLEVHAELSTKTKIFCSCTTEFGGEANTHTCPVCLGLPGTLPVLNRKVVEYDVEGKSMKDVLKLEYKPGQESEGIKFLHFTDKLK